MKGRTRRAFTSLALASCIGLAITGKANAAESATLRLDWSLIGYHAPFFLAKERGYYSDVGIDLKISEGSGSGNTVQVVGNGTDTFGFADASVAARAISIGVPVKVVMGILRKTPSAIVTLPASAIKSPNELKGRTILSCAGQGAQTFLPPFLHAVGLETNDVTVTNVACDAIYPLLVQGKADAATGYTPGSRSILARLGVTEFRHFDYADAGISLPSHGIVAGTKTISSNPALVRRFAAATARGWTEALKNPDAAIASLVNAKSLLKGKEASLKAELLNYAKYIDTPATKGKPFGWQSPEEWQSAVQLLTKYMGVQNLSVDSVFTNEFVPD